MNGGGGICVPYPGDIVMKDGDDACVLGLREQDLVYAWTFGAFGSTLFVIDCMD
jgi:hypothetical protein